MHGVINLLKPPGMTSHDAVAFVRRVCGTRRVGHTGTLDPAAAGVLPICVGLATRLVEDLQAGTKEYRAEATFGYETDSCDATGDVVREADTSQLDLETLRRALDPFRGEIEQTPPMHSAVKVGGRRLYELARAGEEIEIPTRRVSVPRLMVTGFRAGTQPVAMLNIECTGGTYIRSLVRDIGRSLNSAATMTFLVRTGSGSFALNKACSLEELEADPRAHTIPLLVALSWCARINYVNDEATHNLAQGKQVQLPLALEDRSFSRSPREREDATHPTPQRLSCFPYHEAKRGRAAFQSADGTVAVLARRISGLEEADQQEATYQPEKVFDLRQTV